MMWLNVYGESYSIFSYCTNLFCFFSIICVFIFFFFFSSRRRHTRWSVTGVQTCALPILAGEKFSYDARAMTRSGTAIDIQVAVAPLLDQANQWIGSISVARDVTQHKRSEEALRLAREAAESANHAKSSFLARMSHEIRTPMNGVLGMTELLLETGLTSAQRKYAETVQRSGQNLLGIINDLLDFSKIEAGKLELENVDMDLRRTLEDVVDLLAERARAKGLELACSIPANLATHVKGDPLRLGQVLTNLVGNAIKFTEQGSVVIQIGRAHV